MNFIRSFLNRTAAHSAPQTSRHCRHFRFFSFELQFGKAAEIEQSPAPRQSSIYVVTSRQHVTVRFSKCGFRAGSKNFNIELREVIFGAHLRKHLRTCLPSQEVTPCVTKLRTEKEKLKKNNVNSLVMIDVVVKDIYTSRFFRNLEMPKGRVFH